MERGNFMSAGIGKRRHLTEAGFVVMWSSGFIGASLGTPEAGTPTLMVWRFLLAAGLLLVGILLLRRRWPGLREMALRPSSPPSNPSWPRPSLVPHWAST